MWWIDKLIGDVELGDIQYNNIVFDATVIAQ